MAKYDKVSNYWVYSIKVPSIGKFYIGISKQPCNRRWRKTQYESSSLQPYLDEWDSMIKTVLVDNLSSKKEALTYEDNIIRALQMNDLCINERRSGLIYASDANAYNKQYYENNHEHLKQYKKQWQLKNKEKKREYDKKYRLSKKTSQN